MPVIDESRVFRCPDLHDDEDSLNVFQLHDYDLAWRSLTGHVILPNAEVECHQILKDSKARNIINFGEI